VIYPFLEFIYIYTVQILYKDLARLVNVVGVFQIRKI